MTPSRPRRYFAYGSNLHPLRLGRRTPSCRQLGTAALPAHDLRFHKLSEGDGSAKADARYTGRTEDAVLGVVYEMDVSELEILDEIEGLGGYRVEIAEVGLAGNPVSVFFYAARETHIDPVALPFDWYRDLIWRGAAWQDMPAHYVERIRQVEAVPDPDARRSRRNAELLALMPGWRPEHGYDLP
ncbi:MAG: gamma-glutamylcyclotransferase [Ectothiorhodospiraceae bacterium]